MESTSYVLSFRTVFFYLVTAGWIFNISLCENSINQLTENAEATKPIPPVDAIIIQETGETATGNNREGSAGRWRGVVPKGEVGRGYLL